MSYDPRLAARPYGVPGDGEDGSRKGSVRAARERMQSASKQRQMLDQSRIIGLPQRPNQHIVPNPSSPLRQQELSIPDGAAGGALSPQWPLPSNSLSPVRGPPPQRPPRPVSDDLPIQQLSPGYRESFQSDEMFSPTSNQSRPLTTSSAASEASSLGSIPDFPVPDMPVVQPLPRRNPSLGPPPSSRRGPSSYYTQMSYVSPIAEESETRSNTIRSHHGSFASSNVMPYNNDYYVEDAGFQSEDDETITSDYGRESRASDHDDSSGLVTPALLRQASLGRRTKPSLMTIKSGDSFPPKRKPEQDGGEMPEIPAAVMAARDGIAGRGSVAFDPSEGSTFNSLRDLKDPEKEAFAQAAAAGRGARPRPPRLDMDAVRDAEARGSLTSLPELIRRATRLAANLDRGKTASRLSLNFWEAGAPPKNGHKSGSMTDMLAAFPNPGAVTPNGAATPNPKASTKWPSDTRSLGTDSALSGRKGKKRRCCGMPMWTFVTLLIVLFFLIAAAVVIPIALIVIPRMKNGGPPPTQEMSGMNNNGNNGNSNNNGNTGNGGNANAPAPAPPTSSSGTQNGQCNGIINCQNGGVAVLNADRTCNCVCINGFTGSTCATARDAGCTTMSVPGTTNNATVGTGIPRLVQSAEGFQIPINTTRLMSVFSSLSMSCTAENALITFNGLASRSVPQGSIPLLGEGAVLPRHSLPKLEAPHRSHAFRFLEERQAIGQPGTAKAPTPVPANTGKASTSAAPEIVQPISSNSTALDFARVSVLVALLETEKLDTAANAQEAIQRFLADNRNGNSRSNTVSVGPLTVDLVQLSIKFQNGTTVQAKGRR